jgi:RHS repeat-associated protein
LNLPAHWARTGGAVPLRLGSGRLPGTLSATDANGDTTTFTYDDVGNLLTLTDAEDNTTTYTYDALGQVVTDTNELNGVCSYVYDALGNVIQKTDRDGRVTQCIYNMLGQLTTENRLDSSNAVIHTITYTYDAVGQMTEASDADSTYQYEYDDLGRLIQQTQTFADLTPVIVLNYIYDDVGNCTQVAAIVGGVADYVTDYSHDDLGRVTSIRQHGVTGGNAVAEKRIDFTYDAVGQYATVTRYADLAGTQLVSTATYTFDDAYQLVGLTYTKGTTTLGSYAYTYDDSGSMTSMTTVDGTTDYTNDDTGQLTGADSDYTDDEAYVYDDTGNRVTANGSTYVTGADNRLLSDGSYRYSYDAEGNRTAKFVDTDTDGVLDSGDNDITTYTWDHRDRLTEVDHYSTYSNYSTNTSDQIVEYEYDAFNRLIGRTLDADGSAGTGDIHQAVYVYDGKQVAVQFDKTYANGSASDLAASDLSHRYLWNSQALDQLFADEQLPPLPPGEGQGEGSAGYDLSTPGNVLWALTDHENSVRDLATYNSGTDATTVANHRIYDSFGNLKSETNSAVDCLFGYTGRQSDDATGLQNNLNRWYDSVVGRWASEDPIGFLADDANLYRYCENSPTDCVDPSGLKLFSWRMLNDAKNLLIRAGISNAELQIRMTILTSLLLSGTDSPNMGCSDWACQTLLNGYGEHRGPNGPFRDPASRLTMEVLYPDGLPRCKERDLLPGDQVFIDNPYYDKNNPRHWGTMEDGVNTFVVGKNARGDALFYDRRTGSVKTLKEFRQYMGTWKTVREALNGRPPDHNVFLIKRVRYPVVR